MILLHRWKHNSTFDAELATAFGIMHFHGGSYVLSFSSLIF